MQQSGGAGWFVSHFLPRASMGLCDQVSAFEGRMLKYNRQQHSGAETGGNNSSLRIRGENMRQTKHSNFGVLMRRVVVCRVVGWF